MPYFCFGRVRSDTLKKTNNHKLSNSELRNFSTKAGNKKNMIFLATRICVYAVKYRIFSKRSRLKMRKVLKFRLAHGDSNP